MSTSTPRLLNFALLLLLVPLAVVACSTKSALSSTPATPDYVIVGDISGYPEGCNPDQVTDRILQFFAAYNEGNQEQLASFFSPRFEWYSDSRVELVNGRSKRIHFVTRPGSREELLDYFAERHEQNEQLTLHMLSVSAWRSAYVDITFSISRQADDIQPDPDGMTLIGDGKGAFACRSQKIFVWGLGDTMPYDNEEFYQSCLEPEAAADDVFAAIVCIKTMGEK